MNISWPRISASSFPISANSDKKKVQELNYLDLIADPTAKTYVRKHYPQIELGTRQLLAKMEKEK